MNENKILKQGKNCWRIEQAGRVSFLVDTAEYFEAFVSGVKQAKKTVYISGWDIDSRILLYRRPENGEAAVCLEEFLNKTASHTQEILIYILCWDYSMIYAREREFLPVFRLGWKTHKRIDFRTDSEHPIGASHHQKFVVIDDMLAFCGGIDLSKMRWDTPDHQPGDPRRTDPDGNTYAPFHDIQMAVDGDAARALGDVFRDRWQRATGETIYTPDDSEKQPWPQHIEPDLKNVQVAVARTFPEFKERPKVEEVAALYQDSILAAEKYIYTENQYLTSSLIADALSASLERTTGPEIILVLPKESSGWLEKSTMDAIRFRVLSRLTESDSHHRLRVFYPTAENGAPIYVHAKVMIVDDRFVRIGSSNLSNRSMAFDSECDLAVEGASGSANEAGIKMFRNRLLAEHLGVDPDTVDDVFKKSDSLIQTVEFLSQNSRTLKPMDITKDNLPVDTVSMVEDPKLIDPDEPMEIDRMLDHFVEEDEAPSARMRWLKTVVVLIVLALMAAAWRWTPLSEWIDIENLKAWAYSAKEHPLTLLWVVVAYIAGGLVMVPVTLMIGATAVVFSPLLGSFYALTGCLASAVVSYGIGAVLGAHTLRNISGRRVIRLSKRLADPGIMPIVVARNIPIAPFTIVNLIAGASRINLKDYILGTAIGMLPGIGALSIFTDRIAAAIRDPSWMNIAITLIVVVAFGIGIWWLKKRLFRVSSSR